MRIKEQLINNVLWNGDNESLENLEVKAYEKGIFEVDNGREIKKKHNESLGNYLDRYSIDIMKNFSKEKYERFKSLNNLYKNNGDINDFGVIEEDNKHNFNLFSKVSNKIMTLMMIH